MAALAAIMFASLFLGLAGYGLMVESPARRTFDPDAARQQWQALQVRAEPLLILGAVLAAGAGLWVAFRWDQWRWAIGSVVILASWGFAVVGQYPLGRALKHAPLPEVATILARWDRLHIVRTGLGAAALLIFLAGWRALG